jgi:hypothetical protein
LGYGHRANPYGNAGIAWLPVFAAVLRSTDMVRSFPHPTPASPGVPPIALPNLQNILLLIVVLPSPLRAVAPKLTTEYVSYRHLSDQ